jgi:hypothetical protein
MSWFPAYIYLVPQHEYDTAVSYAHRITTAVFGITIRYETYVSELNFIALPVPYKCRAVPGDVRKGSAAPPLRHGARVCRWLIAD